MSTVIHIELDILFLLILSVIAIQINRSVSKQMNRILFRMMVYGIMITISLDVIWMVIDGAIFPGAVVLNKIVNALFLGANGVMGCIWYLYVLETLGYQITRKLSRLMLFPGVLFLAFNIASIWTGWFFTVNEKNVYIRGSLFWLQMILSMAMPVISLIHILIRLLRQRNPEMRKLLCFYIPLAIGAFLSILYAGMPDTWTCAAASVILIYMDNQDGEILRDSLTGLNNRKALNQTFSEYARQAREHYALYLFMMDLDRFKEINDSFGHFTGDEALVTAATLVSRSVAGQKAIVARYGGDEFLVMGFFTGDEAAKAYQQRLMDSFQEFNRSADLPYELRISIGYSRYKNGQKLEELIRAADHWLYTDKKRVNL